MRRLVSRGSVCVAAIVLTAATCANAAPPEMTAPPGVARFQSVPGAVLPANEPQGATNLHAHPGCSRSTIGRAEVELTWTPSKRQGSEQRVGLTTHAADFAGRDFTVSEPLAPDRDSYILAHGIGPGVIHYWQVLTRQAAGWVPSEFGTFEGPVCVTDPVQTGH